MLFKWHSILTASAWEENKNQPRNNTRSRHCSPGQARASTAALATLSKHREAPSCPRRDGNQVCATGRPRRTRLWNSLKTGRGSKKELEFHGRPYAMVQDCVHRCFSRTMLFNPSTCAVRHQSTPLPFPEPTSHTLANAFVTPARVCLADRTSCPSSRSPFQNWSLLPPCPWPYSVFDSERLLQRAWLVPTQSQNRCIGPCPPTSAMKALVET